MNAGVVTRTALASALLAVFVGGAFVILLRQVDTLRASGRAVSETRTEFATLDRLEKLVIDLETGLRGYAITGQDRFLQPWRAARSAIPAETRRLEALADGPWQVAQGRMIARGIDSYLADYSLPLIAAVRRDKAAGLNVAVTEEGKRRVDALRGHFATFRAVERRRLTARQQRDDRDAARATTVAVIALGASVVWVLLVGGYLLRSIAVPLRGAAAMAGRLAGGDLTARLPDEGVGEVGALRRAFNSMGAALEASSDELRDLADEQAALRRVATLVAQAVPTAEVFEAVTREVGLHCDADLARMERFERDGTVSAVAAWSRAGVPELAVGRQFALEGTSIAARVRDTGWPARVDSFVGAAGPIAREAQELGIRSSVGCPIIVGGRAWGVIAASTRSEVPFPPDTEARIGEFTELVAAAVSNAQARADLVASRARVLAAADDARRRVVRDLHDGAQQRLVHTIVTLKLARRAQQDGDESADTLLDEALGHAEQANDELRELAHGILPAVLARGGLEAGVEALVSRHHLPVTVRVPADRFPPDIEASAYFVVAEALTNVTKHANAQRADVTAWVGDGQLHVSVRDDGVGGARADGTGLLGLRDRVAALGGRLQVESRPGSGTRIVAALPLSR